MEKFSSSFSQILHLEIWNLIKYFLLRRRIVAYLCLLFAFCLIFNILIFWSFNSNLQFNYEYKDYVDCYIEPYIVLKLLKLFRTTIILNFILSWVYWMYVWLHDRVKELILPISNLNRLILIFLIQFVSQLLGGILFMVLLSEELNGLLTTLDWKGLPFNKQHLYFELFQDLILFSIMGAIFITFSFNLLSRIKLILLFFVSSWCIVSSNILPGSLLIEKLNTICPTKKT